jgi:hypothetical protein
MSSPRDETTPTNLSDYAWVEPPEAWAMQDALDTTTGEACVVLGLRLRGVWGGIRLPYSVASDVVLTLGSWPSDIANADIFDDEDDTDA